MSIDIPPGLTAMLQDFTVAVLRTKPPDLYKFAADHFNKLYTQKKAAEKPAAISDDECVVNKESDTSAQAPKGASFAPGPRFNDSADEPEDTPGTAVRGMGGKGGHAPSEIGTMKIFSVNSMELVTVNQIFSIIFGFWGFGPDPTRGSVPRW